MSTRFFTNSNERSLFDKFTGILGSMKDVYAFHAVVGYFRSSGYFKLQPYLKDVKEIKILVGINVDAMFAEAQRRGMIFFGDEARTKREFTDLFVKDIGEAKYSKEVEDGILQFIQDLLDGRIEVRAHPAKTIHAKFYLFLPEQHTEHSDGWVIMGSSNLTEAGLGIKRSPNYELNVALKSYDDVKYATDEFASLWKDATPILPADIKEAKEKTHIDKNFTPYELYLKFLIEYFGKNIDYDPDTVGDLPSNFKKLSYQVDAVNEGFRMLMEHNGFFLADVVGLGKTVVAAMIAKRFLIANGTLQTKVLVVYPPAVEKNWKTTFRHFGIDKHCKFITNGSLEKILLRRDPNYWPKEDYDLILVDEAHRYRNHTSQMFQNLQKICKARRTGEGLLEGRKRVVLISATPLNNRPADIYHQLLLFQDARRSTLPDTNLQTFFGPIVRQYQEIISSPEPDLDRIREMYKEMRERVLSPLTIRRTRKDLQNYPKYKEDIAEQGIVFPEIGAPRPIKYELAGALGELFVDTMRRLTEDVGFFRYQAVDALNDKIKEEFYPQAGIVSRSLAHIFKTLMVKRLESSFHAFRRTLRNVTVATERMIEMFENDKVFIAPDLDVNNLMDKGFSMEEIEQFILERSLEEGGERNRIFTAAEFEPTFIENLRSDAVILNELRDIWRKVKSDPKLETFIDAFEKEFRRHDLNKTGKLVIFSESKDTADYLHEKLKERLGIDALNISAANRDKLFETITANFDANFEGEHRDEHDILITTDVLAEGINLHRANVIVNYDTPWNATRLMQRIGRVNRIGSVVGTVHSFNFYPSPQGDALIRLYNKALVKLQSFHSAFGEDAKIFTHEEMVEQFALFSDGVNEEEDLRLHYLREIREFKENNPAEFKRISKLPEKARTARHISAAGKQDLGEDTVVFLKSQYKTEFYQVSDAASEIKTLTFLEAAAIFKADPLEAGAKVPEFHFEHVSASLAAFDKDFFGGAAETVTSTDKADAQTNQARKFLRDIRGITKNDTVRDACNGLIEHLSAGTYAALPKEVRTIGQKVTKRNLTWPQAEPLIMHLAKKYDVFDKDDNVQIEELAADVQPSIVLSETFIDR